MKPIGIGIGISAILLPLMMMLFSSVKVQPQQPTAPDVSEATKSGIISGKVVNESGQPLSEVSVSIRTYASPGSNREAVTDRDGAFRFSGLAPVVYLASANLAAHVIAPRDPDSTQTTSYRVGDTITLVMIKGGVITGAVTSSTGDPLVGVRVRAQMIRDGNGQQSRYGATIRERTTDDRGIYRIYGLPTGTYLVFAGGGTNYPGSSTAYENDSPTYSPSSTRDTAAEINVRTGEETAGVDIRYRGELGHTVSGIARGPQGPEYQGFSITLTSTVDAGSQWNETTFQPPGSRGFVLSGIADGDYDVTAQSYFPNGDRMVSEPKRIKVRGVDVTGVELITKPLGSISGMVVLENSKAVECKGKRRAVVTETLVSAWHNEKEARTDQPQFVWSLGGPSYPNEQGEIELRNLAPGQYQIITRLFAKYWYLKSITLPSTTTTGTKSPQVNRLYDAVANWATLKPGERLTGLVVTLADGAASLRGQLRIEDGQALPPRLYVYLVPAEAEKAKDVLRYLAAPVSQEKEITLNNVPPGRYWVIAQSAINGALSQLAKLRSPDEAETRSKLRRDAEAAKIEIEFKPCQNVTGYQLPWSRQ
jgi:Carboxypeptidase regulatory-like domain